MPHFHDAGQLIDFLASPIRQNPVVWIFGSGLTCTAGRVKGVPGTTEMIRRLRSVLEQNDSDSVFGFDAEIEGHPLAVSYQKAFEYAQRKIPLATIDEEVRIAVLDAYKKDAVEVREDLKKGDFGACRAAVLDAQSWRLRPALEYFGQVAKKNSALLGKTILTTNFDPLIEVALKKSDLQPVTTIIDEDGAVGHTQTEHAHVVHLHGYWFGSSTLHTIAQLKRERQRLDDSLRQLLRRSDVCVMGYGGWDDVIVSALKSVIIGGRSQYQVHWCFFDDNVSSIEKDHEKLFTGMRAAGHLRLLFYKGINADEFFPQLLARLEKAPVSIDQGNTATAMMKRFEVLESENEQLDKRNKELKSKLEQLELAASIFKEADLLAARVEALEKKGESIRSEIQRIGGDFLGRLEVLTGSAREILATESAAINDRLVEQGENFGKFSKGVELLLQDLLASRRKGWWPFLFFLIGLAAGVFFGKVI